MDAPGGALGARFGGYQEGGVGVGFGFVAVGAAVEG